MPTDMFHHGKTNPLNLHLGCKNQHYFYYFEIFYVFDSQRYKIVDYIPLGTMYIVVMLYFTGIFHYFPLVLIFTQNIRSINFIIRRRWLKFLNFVQ